ncbi:hypothetical protein PIB30_026934 [Stylosanthes scabra]|uniref:Uncharacterized protein n=1 Tax=Stylosanthes scabra TaxID=79078 RepID=A0ABU6Y995_9FABA|nr:hypothetical protein [Stylosanthes scabra]
MVSIKSIHTVIPSEATPNGTFLLSQSQQINAPNHICTANNNISRNHIIIDTMKHSLAKILVHYYPLAGRLRMIEGGRMEVECNGNGVLLLEAESTNTLEDYAPPCGHSSRRLITVNQWKTCRLLWCRQVTRFACGGLCVGVANTNVVEDGISGTLFIDAWAKLARGGTLGEDEKPLFLDKMVILESESNDEKSFSASRFEHREFKPLPVIIGRCDASEESKKETDLAILKVTREMAEKIKKKANDDDGCFEFDHDAITAQKHR